MDRGQSLLIVGNHLNYTETLFESCLHVTGHVHEQNCHHVLYDIDELQSGIPVSLCCHVSLTKSHFLEQFLCWMLLLFIIIYQFVDQFRQSFE